jgi:hypothetical protein
MSQVLAMVSDGDSVPSKVETVMSPGMTITATTSTGRITIRAEKGFRRSYTWEGATRTTDMLPRQKRWYGSLGIYSGDEAEKWKEHKGISRGVTQEGQQHFKNEAECQATLIFPYQRHLEFPIALTPSKGPTTITFPDRHSSRACRAEPFPGRLSSPGETEAGSAGTQPDQGLTRPTVSRWTPQKRPPTT